MARNQRKYDHEYKVQAVKLAREIGGAKAAKELGIPEGTIHTWLQAVRSGSMNIGDGYRINVIDQDYETKLKEIINTTLTVDTKL